MVSGAGGSISELCRQILNQNPSVLLPLRYIRGHFIIHAEFTTAAKHLCLKLVHTVLGSNWRLEVINQRLQGQTFTSAYSMYHW